MLIHPAKDLSKNKKKTTKEKINSSLKNKVQKRKKIPGMLNNDQP